jgi:hypothetical protein
MTHSRRIAVAIIAAALMVGLLAPSAATAHDQRHRKASDVTSGEFITLPGGKDLGYTIEGHAVMMRVRNRTVVGVHVRGLDADATYPAHVHNAPCSATPNPGGSHYQHEAGVGPDFVNDVNEIWPTVTTNRLGRGHGHAVHGNRARDDAMSIVIHYPANTSIRLACADLT